MKKFLFIATMLFATLAGKAQDAGGVVNALKSGNPDNVSAFFYKILDLQFPDKEEIKNMGKNQAGIAFKSFYDNNNINGFEFSSQRELNGTMYVTGRLTNSGQGFKISIMMKTKDGQAQIVTVRIS